MPFRGEIRADLIQAEGAETGKVVAGIGLRLTIVGGDICPDVEVAGANERLRTATNLDDPIPTPFTTIARRMCHISVSPLLRYDYTFGDRSLTLDDVDWPATAQDAVAFLGETHRRWRVALATLDPDDALTVGLSQFPYGLDASVRLIALLAWTNTEFTHHAAEIACLRDLYRARSHEAPRDDSQERGPV